MIVLLLVGAHCVGLRARLAQSAERKALNLVVVGSSPTVGAVALWLSSLSTGIRDLKKAGQVCMWSIRPPELQFLLLMSTSIRVDPPVF